MKVKVFKNKIINECPHCKSEKFIAYGRDKGVQKFRCSNINCKKIFRNKDYSVKKRLKADNELIRSLLSVIEANIEETNNQYMPCDDLKVFQANNINNERLDNLSVSVKSLKKERIFKKNPRGKRAYQLKCINPLAILCLEGDELKIIKIPKCDFSEFQYSMDEEENVQKLTLMIKTDETVPSVKNKKKQSVKNSFNNDEDTLFNDLKNNRYAAEAEKCMQDFELNFDTKIVVF